VLLVRGDVVLPKTAWRTEAHDADQGLAAALLLIVNLDSVAVKFWHFISFA
jgi:hypothetical protein